MQPPLKLLYTEGCHLCDDAQALLDAAACHYSKQDIFNHAALEAAYGTRIPVLLSPSQQKELAWPFDALALQNFLECLS